MKKPKYGKGENPPAPPKAKAKAKANMASYHLSVKVGAKGKALPHANYIAREGDYKTRQGEKLEATEHGNMPEWAKENPSLFWQCADQYERKNGSTYREIEIALPRELTPEQRKDLVKEFVDQELGNKHAYTWAIHTPKASIEGGEQPHAHIMFSERTQDGINRSPDQFFKRYNSKDPTKGGAKKANTGLDHATRKEQIKQQRERWGQLCNKHLERIGSRERVDMRNYKERGADKPQNISMSDMLKPEIKQAYKDKLTSRADLKHALFERVKTVGNPTKALADIEQRPKPQEIKKQSELTAVSEPSPQPKTQTPLETHSKRLEPQENKQATQPSPQPEKPLQSENKTPSEPKPKTLKEYLTGLSHENRQKIKNHYNKVINDYIGAIDKKAVELYHKATPPNKRQKPLFSHYKEHDMDAVQPYKALAQQEIDKADPSKYQEYIKGTDTLNELNKIEQSENLQRQLEAIQERNRASIIELKR